MTDRGQRATLIPKNGLEKLVTLAAESASKYFRERDLVFPSRIAPCYSEHIMIAISGLRLYHGGPLTGVRPFFCL